MRSIVPVIYANGAAIAGASVRLNIAPNQWVSGTTGADGTANLVVSDSLQDTQFEVTANGFQPYGTHVNLGLSGNLQIRVGLGADPNRPHDIILPPLTPVAPPVPILIPSGPYFVDQSGARAVLNGTGQFSALRQFIDGVDLSPLIRESRELGFNCWRIFCQGSIAQNGVLNLFPQQIGNYYGLLAEGVRRLNAAGILPLLTVFVQYHDVKLGTDHWLRVADAVRPHSVLLSGRNEWKKNGFDPQSLPNPNVPLWSRGSSLGDDPDGPPVMNGAVFAEWHPRRDFPRSLDDTVASYTNLTSRGWTRLIVDEPPRMGADGSDALYADPEVCWRFARHYSTEWAGAVFHSRAGQKGVLMDAVTRACAQRWSEGMRIRTL